MRARTRTGRLAIALALALGMPAALTAPALASPIAPPELDGMRVDAPTTAPPAPPQGGLPERAPADPAEPDADPADPSDPGAPPTASARVIDAWTTSIEFDAAPGGGGEARFVESVLLSSGAQELEGGLVHSFVLEPHPGFADPADRLVDVAAVAIDGGAELELDTIVDIEPLDDGAALVTFEVLDDRGGLEVAEYRLSYALLEPFAPVPGEADATPMVAALTLGSAAHPETIQSYRANVKWGPVEPHELECFVVRADAGDDECVMVGDALPTELRAEGPLLADEHLELVMLHDPALDAAPEPMPYAPDESPAPEPAPEAEAPEAERSLDAPAWTGFAAGGGLAVMGLAALVLARRAGSAA